MSQVCGGARGCATSSLRQGAGHKEDGESQKEEGWLRARRRSRGGCERGGGAEVAAARRGRAGVAERFAFSRVRLERDKF